MKIDVEVISRHTLRPSSPTPDHLRNYQLSFLDQISLPVFMPLVFFYPADSNHNKLSDAALRSKSNLLRTSLSEALTRFYPLAGRLVDNLYINCNDEGIPYVEARANCKLSEVIQDPVPRELNKFFPYELDDIRDLGMAIQVNFFHCGGVAVAVGVSHKLADALSFCMFVNSWAAIARGDSDMPCPRFESATLFPPRDITGFRPTTGIVKENIVTKRFVFSASNIAALRDEYARKSNKNGEYPRRPTRIESLSAFVWSRFMAATEAKADPNKIYTVLHAVNLRTRVDPPVPECYFGNITRIAIAELSTASEEECYGVVNKVRDAIRKVNGDYIMSLREGDKHLNFIKERAERFTKGELVTLNFTSLCRFPLYEADFGWGKPIWVGSTCLIFKNLITFMDTPSGDGIEAWVNLKEEAMAKFEVDEELLAFVSQNPGAKNSGS